MMQQSIPRRTAILLVAGALSTLAARNATAQTPELELPKAKSVVALVDKAVALVESKRERRPSPTFGRKGASGSAEIPTFFRWT